MIMTVYVIYPSSKFVSDKWMAEHEFIDLEEFQEKQWYVCIASHVLMYTVV